MKNTDKNSRCLMAGLKGIARDEADVVPGVSGGTAAFITGICCELLVARQVTRWCEAGFALIFGIEWRGRPVAKKWT